MCNGTVHHGSIDYTEIALDACLPLAQRLQSEGKPWHSHVLSPGCRFNPFKDQYAAVVEDDESHTAYIAPSNGFPEVDKQLVRMLHGDDILDASHPSSAEDALLDRSPLLARLVAIDGDGKSWHHHMNFPDCALNPHRGRWAITIESGADQFSESYDDEPRDILRAIEVRYFRNLASRG